MFRRKPLPKPDYANIRKLELELGFRERDVQDERDLYMSMASQMRMPSTLASTLMDYYLSIRIRRIEHKPGAVIHYTPY